MITIPCPWCGPRDEVEFSYGGQAHVAYPQDPYALSDQEWAEYLFYRDNPKGDFAERWYHSAGCRRWFNAIRDTVTYRFASTYTGDKPRSNKPSSIEPIDNEPINNQPRPVTS